MINTTIKIFLFIIFCYVTSADAFAGASAQVTYMKAIGRQESLIENEIRSSYVVEDVAAFINEQFRLSSSLYFKIGGEDGPLYDSASNEIIIPYSFIEEIQARFADVNYAETGVSVKEATLDALMHTLFHELAHALIWSYELPVLGKEEDAADSLASVLLIEYFDNGAEIAISAADLFDLESQDLEEFVEDDFWDEHSLDAQRFYNTLCYVYGSDPERYVDLKDEIGFSDDRAELCISEYEQISHSWFRLLSPYFRHQE